MGTGLAQLLPLAISPILTRYYTEADFGLMASISSISDILAVAICGRYQLAIMLPPKKEEAFSVSALSILIAGCLSIIILIPILLFSNNIETLVGVEGISQWLIFIPVITFLIGVWNTLNLWVARAENFKLNASSKVVQGIGNSSCSILFSKLTLLYLRGGLIIGRVSGLIFSILNLIRFYINDIKVSSLSVKVNELKLVAKKFQEYPKYNLIPAVLNTFSINALFLVLGKNYSIQELGYYNLTNLCLLAPVALVSTSIRDVLYQQFTKIVNSGESPYKFFMSASLFLTIIGFPIFIIPFLFGPELFSFVFGQNWIISGQFAAILSATYWIKLIASPLSSIFNSVKRIGVASIWQTFYAITTAIMFFIILFIGMDIRTLFIVYAIHEIVLYFLYYAMEFYYAKKYTPK